MHAADLPRLRITAYTDSYEAGGSDASLISLLRGLQASAEIVVMGPEPEIVDDVARQAEVDRVQTVRRVRDKWDAPAIVRHIRAIRELRPDVVHANLRSPWSCQYALLAGSLTRGVRTVAVHHAVLPPRNARQTFFNRANLSRVDAQTAPSRFAARGIEEDVGLPAGTIRVIPGGVPEVELDPVARPAPGPIVGALSRLSGEKGMDVLLRAVARLPAATLVLVGDGPDRASLERLARELSITERVIVTGWLPNARSWLPVIDVVAVPSLERSFESQSLAATEAMFAGVPVVASRVGGLPEVVVDGETGMLVEPGDPVALAGAIERLLGDRQLRERMGAQARSRAAERFSVEQMIASFEALYAELLPDHRLR
jgi:glycosyltransferase involved in cell wall biosynthesis